MNIKRVTLCGYTGKEPKAASTQKGLSTTRLSLATSKRYKDAENQWQVKTQWHNCVAYGSTADYLAKLPTGSHVLLEGELIHREYERTIETETGPVQVQWPITEVAIQSVSLFDPKEKRGAA